MAESTFTQIYSVFGVGIVNPSNQANDTKEVQVEEVRCASVSTMNSNQRAVRWDIPSGISSQRM